MSDAAVLQLGSRPIEECANPTWELRRRQRHSQRRLMFSEQPSNDRFWRPTPTSRTVCFISAIGEYSGPQRRTRYPGGSPEEYARAESAARSGISQVGLNPA
jgi:hypothetical protein